jgi:hypothetical protein
VDYDLQLLKLEVLAEVGAEVNIDSDDDSGLEVGLHFALLLTINNISSNTNECELNLKCYML